MVDNLFDNRYALTYQQTSELLNNVFNKLQLNFKKIKSDNNGMSFMIKYKLGNNVFFSLQSERGYISYTLKIRERKIDLIKFEPLLIKAEVTSKKNLLYILNVLTKYFKNNPL